MKQYLAVDIGASGGRHILGRLEEGKIRLEEIHRFPNALAPKDGEMCWDTGALLAEITAGIGKCAPGSLAGVGIDTWGVDFVLLDKEGGILGGAVGYRDGRTEGMDAAVHAIVPEAEAYARTGIRKQIYNTVYQLTALKMKKPRLLEEADCLLLTPDYLHYKLYGEKRTEYTIASTTGLVNAVTRDWDWEMIDRLGFPRRLFLPVRHGLTPAHDTAGAFLAVPAVSDAAVTISSGTWSLLGVLRDRPVLTEAAREAGFTNEGGWGGKIRFLKNIMGLWMIQSIRKELPGEPSFAELERSARASSYAGRVCVDSDAFFAPRSMTEAVTEACVQAGFPPPDGAGDLARCVYHSLAAEYARSIEQLQTLTGTRYTSVNIIGGGSRDGYLNGLTAQMTGLTVYAGPGEGTALGSIVSQMINGGVLKSVEEARDVIRRSFEIREFGGPAAAVV